MSAPLVSVIISAFNSESYIEEAIASVLGQEWEPLELIIVDDGSTDDTAALARRFGPRLRVLGGPEQGLAATRNRGIEAAHGAYLMHFDADDVLAQSAIRNLMEVFQQEDRCDIVAGRLSSFLSPDISNALASRLRVPHEPQRGHLSGVAIVRRDVFERVGPLNESYNPAVDLEWWQRAGGHGVNIRLIDEVVAYRRIHGANSSLRNGQLHKDVSLRIVREALARKRTRTD